MPLSIRVRMLAFLFRNGLASLFVAFGLPTALLLVTLTPIGQVADEIAHALRVGAIAEGQWLGRLDTFTGPDGRPAIGQGVTDDVGLAHVVTSVGPDGDRKMTRAILTDIVHTPWLGPHAFFQLGTIAVYPPTLYAPAAGVVALWHAIGVRPLAAITAARGLDALLYVALGAAAIALARRGRALIFCALATPMAISLGASLNQDGLLIATAALAASVLTRADPARAGGARVTAAVLLAIVAAAKLPYLALAPVLLLPLPPRRLWRSTGAVMRRRVALVGAVCVPSIAWTAWSLARLGVPLPRVPYAAGPLWPGATGTVFNGTDAMAQLRVLTTPPWRLLTVPFGTMATDFHVLREAIGTLGWLSVMLPVGLYVGWAIALCCSVAADATRAGSWRPAWRDFAVASLCAVACVWAIYVSQYLTWTDVGAARVEGPSGRYLLPILPFVAASLPHRIIRGESDAWRDVPGWLAIAPAAMLAAGLVMLPNLIVATNILR